MSYYRVIYTYGVEGIRPYTLYVRADSLLQAKLKALMQVDNEGSNNVYLRSVVKLSKKTGEVNE